MLSIGNPYGVTQRKSHFESHPTACSGKISCRPSSTHRSLRPLSWASTLGCAASSQGIAITKDRIRALRKCILMVVLSFKTLFQSYQLPVVGAARLIVCHTLVRRRELSIRIGLRRSLRVQPKRHTDFCQRRCSTSLRLRGSSRLGERNRHCVSQFAQRRTAFDHRGVLVSAVTGVYHRRAQEGDSL